MILEQFEGNLAFQVVCLATRWTTRAMRLAKFS